MKRIKRYILLSAIPLLCALALLSCKKAESNNPVIIVERPTTLLVYAVANNNLSSRCDDDINDMMKGFIPDAEGNLVVYKHGMNMSPVLLHLKRDGSDIVADTVYKFPPRNSADKSSLTQAMKVTKTLFPAQKYGLLLWSHSTGWMPSSSTASAVAAAPSDLPFHTFGQDGNKEMDITDLANALAYKLSFIIADCCFMGGVECAYELKDSVDYYIASPTEIRADGFPYRSMMQFIFKQQPDLTAVAQEYYNFYNSMAGMSRSGTIALIDCSKLDAVADIAKEIFNTRRTQLNSVNKRNIQSYYRSAQFAYFNDIKDLMDAIAEPSQAARFEQVLNNAIIYKAATPYFMELEIERFSGMSIYVPQPSDSPSYKEYYKKYKWNSATNMIE